MLRTASSCVQESMFLVDVSCKVRKLANSDNYQVLKLAYFYEI